MSPSALGQRSPFDLQRDAAFSLLDVGLDAAADASGWLGQVFVGRTAELSALQSTLERVRLGRPTLTLVGGRVPTEASGGVRLETIRAIAETGVTYVSVGRLTQSAPAADIGLDFSAR